MKKESVVQVYAAGGCAINIAKTFYEASSKNRKDPGFAKIKTVFLDTSRSNLPAFVTEGFYQIKGSPEHPVDGSGKNRATNQKAVFNDIPLILNQFPPADLNIVLHSAGGGSGAVIGGSLVSELLAQGKDTIAIVVGSTTCEKEIKNTIATIVSYQAISSKRNLPVVAMYFENGKNTMVENDAMVRMNILALAAIWSGENHGLDSKDLHNFLNYQNVTQYKPALSGLQFFTQTEEVTVRHGQAFSSVVTLIREGENPDPGIVVGYHSFGTMSQAASDAIELPSPFFLQTIQGYFPPIVADLKQKAAAAEALYANHIEHLEVDGEATDDGLIL